MIRAIETRYAGCRFRSRLEARWAVFFDALEIKWNYEPEGFLVGAVRPLRHYLPDFQLPELDLWVEVKGHDAAMDWTLIGDAVGEEGHHLPMIGPNRDDESWGWYPSPVGNRWGGFGGRSSGAVVLVLGNIPNPYDGYPHHPIALNRGNPIVAAAVFVDESSTIRSGWAHNPPLHVAGPTFGRRSSGHLFSWQEFGEECVGGAPVSVHGACTGEAMWPGRVRAAYLAARSARFEHGQIGAVR